MEFRLPLVRRKLLCVLFLVIWMYLFYSVYFGTNDNAYLEKPKTFLLLVLFSAPDNYFRREAIRNSWLRNRGHGDVAHLFGIGVQGLSPNALASLQKENEQYGDLMLLNTVEGYEKLSAKLLESVKYACSEFEYQYLFKGDDDTFVNLKEMMYELSTKRKTRFYWGFFDGRANVKKIGKWAEPSWILCDKYLPHARGGGYVISSDLAHFISTNADYLQKYRSEDVSMGTWLGALDIERLHDPRFDTEYRSRGCNNKYIVTHKVSTNNMMQLQDNLEQLGRLCKTEVRSRLSFNYDWKALPSLCCIRNDSSIP